MNHVDDIPWTWVGIDPLLSWNWLAWQFPSRHTTFSSAGSHICARVYPWFPKDFLHWSHWSTHSSKSTQLRGRSSKGTGFRYSWSRCCPSLQVLLLPSPSLPIQRWLSQLHRPTLASRKSQDGTSRPVVCSLPSNSSPFGKRTES